MLGESTLMFLVAAMLTGCAGNSADRFLREGKPSEAIAAYEPAAMAHPEDARLIRNLGAAHWSRGDLAVAQGYLEEAAALDAFDPQTHFFRARVHDGLGDNWRAVEAYAAYLEFRGHERAWVRARMRELARSEVARSEVAQRSISTRDSSHVDSSAVESPFLSEVSGRAVAVLDFDDLAKDEAYASLSTGLANLLARDLANATTLKILPREWSPALESAAARDGATHDTPRTEQAVILRGGFRRLGPAGVELTMTLMDPLTGERDSIRVDGALTDIVTLEKALVPQILGWFPNRAQTFDRKALDRAIPQSFDVFLEYCRVVELVEQIERDADSGLEATEISAAITRVFDQDRRFATALSLADWNPTSDSASDVDARELRRLFAPPESIHDLSLDLGTSVGNGPAPDPGVGSQVTPAEGEASDLSITDGSKFDPSLPTIPDFPLPPGSTGP